MDDVGHWRIDRRALLAAASLLGAAAARAAVPKGEALYRTADPDRLRAAALALIGTDSIATLITVDGEGRPRARSVRVSPPDAAMTLWMGTRAGSRKLDQIARRPESTLHFADDAGGSYLSLMGRCRIVADPALADAKSPFQGEARAHYFPDYPRDFVALGFTPDWLELSSRAFPGAKDTWQPDALII